MRPSGFAHTDTTKGRIATTLSGRTKTEDHRAKIGASVSRTRQANKAARNPASTQAVRQASQVGSHRET